MYAKKSHQILSSIKKDAHKRKLALFSVSWGSFVLRYMDELRAFMASPIQQMGPGDITAGCLSVGACSNTRAASTSSKI